MENKNKINMIKKVLEPKSIAIIGASNNKSSIGYKITKNLLDYGYKGDIYPINPKYKKGFGLNYFNSITDCKQNIDMAIIAVNSKKVPTIIDECYKAKVKAVTIISSGFKEFSQEGKELENVVVEKLTKYGICAIGPNSIGILNADNSVRLNATFTKNSPKEGCVAFITQSGALGCGFMNIMDNFPIGISKMISIGNQADITVADMIEYLGNDKKTKQIILYLEAVNDTKKLREIAIKVSKTKPIFVIKAGKSESAQKATLSHTGSMAGNDAFADAFFKQCGIIRVDTLESALLQVYCHSLIPNISGENIVIITNGMGPAILATDRFDEYSIKLSHLSEYLVEKLKKVTQPLSSFNNPIDLIASATKENYKDTLELLLKEKNIDIILSIYLELNDTKSRDIAKILEELKKEYPNKTIVSAYITNNKEYQIVEKNAINVPSFKYTENAVDAINSLIQYYRVKNKSIKPLKTENKQPTKVSKIIDTCKKEDRKLLTTIESLHLLEECGLPIENILTATKWCEIEKKLKTFQFPVVLKLSSKTITHKSDVKGVITNIQNIEELKKEWTLLEKRLNDMNELQNVDGFIVQTMITSKREIVIGSTDDENYGNVLMFGKGGIFVEQEKDVAFKILPLNDCDVNELINSTKVSKLLEDVRNLPQCNFVKLKKVIQTINSLLIANPVIKEIDINPALIDDKNGDINIVDARVILK